MIDNQVRTSRTGSVLEEDMKTEEGPVVRDSAFSEGTFYQSKVVGKAVRKHFFSPPDAALAEAVNLDADHVEFTEAEEVGSVWRRLIA